MKHLLTREELLAPIPCRCGRCDSEGTIYPYPLPNGTMYCPNCCESWLGSYLAFRSALLLQPPKDS